MKMNKIMVLPTFLNTCFSKVCMIISKPVVPFCYFQSCTFSFFITCYVISNSHHKLKTTPFPSSLSSIGTERRTRAQIEEEVENIGASLNAYTAREQIAYIGHSTSESYPQVVDILSDILLHSKLSTSAVEV